MKRFATVLLLAGLTAAPGLGVAQVGKNVPSARPAAAGPASGIDMQVLDARGQAVKIETLPPETQAQVERVRKAAESLGGGADGMQRIKITVRCSWPPLKCSIEVQF